MTVLPYNIESCQASDLFVQKLHYGRAKQVYLVVIVLLAVEHQHNTPLVDQTEYASRIGVQPL